MKASLKATQGAVSTAFLHNCNIHPASLKFWESRIEFHLHHRQSADNVLALVTVEMVANLICRSLTGARDTRQSKGGNPDAGGLAVPIGQTWRETLETLISQSDRAKKGKRQAVSLSETDKAEISGIVGWILSSRQAFNRPLDKMDIGECFRMVEGKNGLNLNRRWKPCDDSEKSLSLLATPTFNIDEEKERIAALLERLEHCQACINAAFDSDKSKQRLHLKKKHLATLGAIVTRTQSGTGKNESQTRKPRKELADYLKRGALALLADRLKSAPWQFDLVTALESLELANA